MKQLSQPHQVQKRVVHPVIPTLLSNQYPTVKFHKQT